MCLTEDFFCLEWLLFLTFSLCVLSPMLEFSFCVLPFPCLCSCDIRLFLRAFSFCDIACCSFSFNHEWYFAFDSFLRRSCLSCCSCNNYFGKKKRKKMKYKQLFLVFFKKSAMKILGCNFTKSELHHGCFPENFSNLPNTYSIEHIRTAALTTADPIIVKVIYYITKANSWTCLTLLWCRPPSYRNQSINLLWPPSWKS